MQRIFRFSPHHASVASLFLMFGSMSIPQAKDFYSESLWTLFSVLALYILAREFDHRGKFSTFKRFCRLVLPISAAFLLNPTLAIAFTILFIYAAFRDMRWDGPVLSNFSPSSLLMNRTLLLGGFAIGMGILIAVAENYARRGDFLNFGFKSGPSALGIPLFSTPFHYGLSGLLVSPSRGAVFFVPAFFLGLWLLINHRQLMSSHGRR